MFTRAKNKRVRKMNVVPRRNAVYGKIINLENYDQCQLKQSLQAIVDAYSGYEPVQRDFVREFPGFVDRRLPNILYMAELADKLDVHHQKCNIATVVGASVGALGGVAAIAGLGVLTVATAGTAAPLLAAAPAVAATGGVTSVLGGLTSFGTFLTERAIEKTELENANELLNEDKKYFERVFPWIQRTAAQEEAVEGIMNFSIFLSMMAAFNDNGEAADAIRREQPMLELPLGIKIFIDDLNIAQEQKQQLKELLLAIFRPVECISLFRIILDLFAKVAPYITKVYSVFDTALRCFRLADATFDAGNTVANLVRSAKPAARFAGAFGILSAVSVAIDVVVLVSTSKDMAAGSKSNLARRVRECAEQMQNEVNALERIYIGLCE